MFSTHVRLMHFDDPVHNGDVPAFDFENEDLPCFDWLRVVVGEEEEVTTIEGRLHATTVCVCVCVYVVCVYVMWLCMHAYMCACLKLIHFHNASRKNVSATSWQVMHT